MAGRSPLRSGVADQSALLSNAQPVDTVGFGIDQAGEFERGLRTGAAGMSAGSFASEALDQELAGQDASSLRARALEQQALAAQSAPTVGSFRDIGGVQDAINYGAGAIGQGAISMAPTIAGAALTIGSRGALRNVLPYVGAAVPAYNLEYNEQVANQLSDPTQMAQSAELRQEAARGKAGVNAALESIVPGGIAKTIGKATGKGFAETIGRNMLEEGLTEATQERVGQIAGQYTQQGGNFDGVTALGDDPDSLIDAGLQGALTGGAVSTPGAATNVAANRAVQAQGELGALGADAMAGAKGALNSGAEKVSEGAKRLDEEMNERFGDSDGDLLDKIVNGAGRAVDAAKGADFQSIIDKMKEYDSKRPELIEKFKERVGTWSEKAKNEIDPDNPDSMIAALKEKDWKGAADNLKEQASKLFKGKNNLQRDIDPLVQGNTQTILFQGLKPEFKLSKTAREAVPELAQRMLALGARTGELSASDLIHAVKLKGTISDIFEDPAFLAERLAQYGKNGFKGMDQIMAIESAASDAQQPNSFLELSMVPEKRAAGFNLKKIGQHVDEWALGEEVSPRSREILRGLFGSDEKADQVLEYYRAKIQETAGIELPERQINEDDGTDDFDARLQGINTQDLSELSAAEPRVFFAHSQSKRPFTRGQKSGAARNKLRSVLAETKGGNSNVRPQFVGHGDFISESGGDVAAELERRKADATKRREAALKKGKELAAQKKPEAQLEHERRKVMEANKELRTLNQAGEDPRDVLNDLYQVVKVNEIDPSGTKVDDNDIFNMGRSLRQRTKDDAKNKANASTKLDFIGPTGSPISLSAHDIARVTGQKLEKVGNSESGSARTRRAFAEGVANLIGAGYKLKDGQDLGKVVVDRRTGLTGSPQGNAELDDVWTNTPLSKDVVQRQKELERSTSPIDMLDLASNSYATLKNAADDATGPKRAALNARARSAKEAYDNALRKVYPMPERRELDATAPESEKQEALLDYRTELESLLSDVQDYGDGELSTAYEKAIQARIDSAVTEGAGRFFEEDTGLSVGSEKRGTPQAVVPQHLREKVAPPKVNDTKVVENKTAPKGPKPNIIIRNNDADIAAEKNARERKKIIDAKREARSRPDSRTPEYNKLPARDPANPTKTYAGVGSRQTPPWAMKAMRELAKRLELQGYTLRTGDAAGADSAFGAGATNKEVFGAKDADDTMRAIAMEIHPNPAALRSQYVLNLMARNTAQVFGRNLDTPADFVVVWTKDAQEEKRGQGGTGQAMQLAQGKNIPVINLAKEGWEARLDAILNGKPKTVPADLRPKTWSKTAEALGLSAKEAADPDVRRYVELSKTTSDAEKESDPKDWTDAEKEAYDNEDFAEFSRLRGYTEKEIADFGEWMDLAKKLDKKYSGDYKYDYGDDYNFAEDLNYGVSQLPNTKLNSQGFANPAQTWSKEEQETVLKEIVRQRGDEIKAEFDSFANIGGSGSYTYDEQTGERLIKIAMTATNPMAVAWHESLHDFFQMLTGDKAGTKMKNDLLNAANSQPVIRQLRTLLAAHPEALKQIETSQEERLAYAYQFFLGGQLRLGTNTQTVFGKIVAFLNKLLKTVTNGDRAEAYFLNLHAGSFANASAQNVATQIQALAPTYGDRMQKLNDLLGDVGNKLLGSTTQRLRDTGTKAAEEIADAFHVDPDRESSAKGLPFLQRRAMANGVWANKAFTVLEKASQDEIRTALANLQAQKSPSSTLEQQISDFLGDMHKYQEVAGVKRLEREQDAKGRWVTVEKPLKKAANYFPRIWDIDKIEEYKDDFIAAVDAAGQDGDKVYQAMLDNRDSGKADLADPDSFTPWNQSLDNRQLTFIDPSNAADFTKFQSQDMADILSTYVNQAVHRAEYARQFGNQGQWLEGKIEEAKAQGATSQDIKTLRNGIQGLQGTLQYDMNPKLRSIMAGVITAQNVILLPLSLFSQVVDAMAIGARANSWGESLKALDAGFKAVARSFTKNADSFTKDERLAMDLGIIDESAMLEAMGMVHHGMYLSKGMKNINRRFFKLNRMEQWNRAMRAQAVVTGQRFILANKDNARYMEELGLDKSDVVELKDGSLAVTEDDGLSPSQARKMRSALFKFVDTAVLRPNAAHRPIWGNDPRFMLLIHLKQFSFTFQNTVLKSMKKELQFGNAKPALVLMGAIPAIMISDLAKAAMLGNIPPDMTFMSALGNGIARSGLLGTRAFGLDAASDLNHGKLPGTSFLGPSFEHATTIAKGILGSPDTTPTDVITRSIPGGALVRDVIKD